MSEKSFPFNAVLTNGEYDRQYSAEDFAGYFSKLYKNGVVAKPANGLAVTSYSGMTIKVQPGVALINGYCYILDQAKTLTLSASATSTYKRRDSIVLRLDLLNRRITLAVKKGSQSSSNSVTAPTPTRTSTVHELTLAEVLVDTGVTSIAQSAINDRRADSSVCGFSQTFATIDGNPDDYFINFQSIFDDFMDNLNETMSGNVVTNLQSQINTLKNSVAGKAMVETGTYTGTGTYGESNKNILTFDFVPQLVIVQGRDETSGNKPVFVGIFVKGSTFATIAGEYFNVSANVAYNYRGILSVAWNNQTVSWYNSVSKNISDTLQLNSSGNVYHYIAIG